MAPVERAAKLPVAYIKENSSENHFTYVSDIRLANIKARIFRAIPFRFACVCSYMVDSVHRLPAKLHLYNLHNIPISNITQVIFYNNN